MSNEAGGDGLAATGDGRRTWLAWALLGGFFLVIQALTWISYFSVPMRSIVEYRTDDTTSASFAPWFEGFYGLLALATVAFVALGVIRERRWTSDALWVGAFACLIWCDQMINYFRPGFYFSANFTNVASWVTHIPGQIAPHADRVPAPYIWIAGVYLGGFLPMLKFVVKGVALFERRTGLRSALAASLVALLLVNVVTLSIELPLLRAGLFAYPAAEHDWSIWGGHSYQYPLIEAVATSIFLFAMFSAMRSEADGAGIANFERGVQAIAPGWRRTMVQQVCRIGFVSTFFLLFPLGITQIGPWHTDPFPSGYARDLHVGWCGDDGQPYGPCPAPGVPWAVRPAGP